MTFLCGYHNFQSVCDLYWRGYGILKSGQNSPKTVCRLGIPNLYVRVQQHLTFWLISTNQFGIHKISFENTCKTMSDKSTNGKIRMKQDLKGCQKTFTLKQHKKQHQMKKWYYVWKFWDGKWKKKANTFFRTLSVTFFRVS